MLMNLSHTNYVFKVSHYNISAGFHLLCFFLLNYVIFCTCGVECKTTLQSNRFKLTGYCICMCTICPVIT